MKKIRVVELFAGVGGFRLGLEGWKKMSASSSYKKPINSAFEVVFALPFCYLHNIRKPRFQGLICRANQHFLGQSKVPSILNSLLILNI